MINWNVISRTKSVPDSRADVVFQRPMLEAIRNQSAPVAGARRLFKPIFIAATYTAKTKARTGIQTVVRSLIAALCASGVDLHLVRRTKWGHRLSLLPQKQRIALGCGRSHGRLSTELAGSWLLVPEVVYNSKDHRM